MFVAHWAAPVESYLTINISKSNIFVNEPYVTVLIVGKVIFEKFLIVIGFVVYDPAKYIFPVWSIDNEGPNSLS